MMVAAATETHVSCSRCAAQARGELPDDDCTKDAAEGKENDGVRTERKSGKAPKAKATPKDLDGVRQISSFFKA